MSKINIKNSITNEDFVSNEFTLYGVKKFDGSYTLEFIEKIKNDTLSVIAISQIKMMDAKIISELKEQTNFVTVYTEEGIKTLELTRIPIIEEDQVTSIDCKCIEFSINKKDVSGKEEMQYAMKLITQKFTELDSENFNEVLNYCIAKVGKAIGADRSYIFKYNFSTNLMENTHEWCEDGIEPEIDNLKDIPISDFLDGWVNEHIAKKTVIIDDVEALDEESNLYQVLHPQGIKSLYTLPLMIGKECWGFIGFDAVVEKRNWTTVPPIIETVPIFIAGTVARKDDIFSIKKAKVELDHAQDNINEFLAKLNHEIKTPLVGLTNALEMLRETTITKSQADYLDTIDYSIDSLRNLVTNVSSEFKGGAEEPTINETSFELEEELVKLISMNKQLANSKKLGLYLTYDYDLPKMVSTDKSKLRQVLNNLIQNGIRYTNYGHVELKVSKVECNPPYVDVQFEIADTGIGISKENVDQIFNSFYREKHTTYGKPTGTGLGLNIANKMVQLLGGQIEVDTEKFVGSSFIFTLKLYSQGQEERTTIQKNALLMDITMNYHSNVKELLEAKYTNVEVCDYEMGEFPDGNFNTVYVHTNDEEYYETISSDVLEKIEELYGDVEKVLLYDNAKKSSYIESYSLYDEVQEIPCTIDALGATYVQNEPEITSIPSDKISVLLVEDNNINRKIMVQLLEKLNLQVTEAEDGFEALEIVAEQKFDLIFMDIFMPGMTGYETTKHIREMNNENSSTPIFAVSANELEKTRTEGMEYGMNGALEKPLTGKVVRKLIETIFNTEDELDQFDQYKVFDEQSFEQMYDKSLGEEIIATFMEEYDNDFKKVKEAYVSKDLDAIHKAVHYMKGTFTYLSATRLKQLAQAILKLSNDNNLNQVLSYEETYFKYLKELKDTLQNY